MPDKLLLIGPKSLVSIWSPRLEVVDILLVVLNLRLILLIIDGCAVMLVVSLLLLLLLLLLLPLLWLKDRSIALCY